MRIMTEFKQQTDQWYAIRNGRITMSAAKALLTKGNGITRMTYLQEVAAEILAGPSKDHYQSYDMLRGIELEPYAIKAYEAHTGVAVKRVGFVLADDERIGCSPDGFAQSRIVEIKCPLPKHHMRYLDKDQAIRDHGAQLQGMAWVCNVDHVDLVSFCPWVKSMPLIIHEMERNEETIKAIEESALRGADEIAAMVQAVQESSHVNKAVGRIAEDAARYWDSYADTQNAEVQLSE